jgi:hypothetical protein
MRSPKTCGGKCGSLITGREERGVPYRSFIIVKSTRENFNEMMDKKLNPEVAN